MRGDLPVLLVLACETSESEQLENLASELSVSVVFINPALLLAEAVSPPENTFCIIIDLDSFVDDSLTQRLVTSRALKEGLFRAPVIVVSSGCDDLPPGFNLLLCTHEKLCKQGCIEQLTRRLSLYKRLFQKRHAQKQAPVMTDVISVSAEPILDEIKEVVLGVNDSGYIVYANRIAQRHLHYENFSVLGRFIGQVLVHEDIEHDLMSSLLNAESVNQVAEEGKYFCFGHAGFFPAEISVSKIGCPGMFPFLIFIRNITHRQLKEASLQASANFDALTGLTNRGYFFDLARQSCSRNNRRGSKAGLLFIDLDNFKKINDLYGHTTGDSVLRHVAVILRNLIRINDVVGRYGGDEFVILVDGIEIADDLEIVAGKVLDALSHPFNIGDIQIKIGVSIGGAVLSGETSEQDVLKKAINLADEKMYVSKQRGGNQYASSHVS